MPDNRELRAFEAIIVSQLLRDRDPLSLEDLPPVGESRLPSDLAAQLWAKVSSEAEGAQDAAIPEEEAAVPADEDLIGAGMNRAEEMDEETRTALEQARREVLDAMRNSADELDDANG